jgi:hypothetical protein
MEYSYPTLDRVSFTWNMVILILRLQAPSSLIVVGSGELQNPQECYTAEQMKRWAAAKASDKTVMIRSEKEVNDKNSRPQTANSTWKFKIQNTRDVAWAASKAFVMDAARINLPSGKKINGR